MLKAGRTQTLTVNRISDYGLYLIDDEQNEVLLPNRYVSLANKVGDTLEVFVYHDSEDRLVATTETPKLREGEAGFLRVVDKNLHGAFLDWGLAGKDLFLPNRNQQGGVLAGRNCLVYLYVDSVTGRCVATMKFKSYVNNDVITVKPRGEVSLLVASESPIGYRVIVNNRHWGMIYRNQLFRRIGVGDRLKGYVTRITEDNRIDVSLQQQGVAGNRCTDADEQESVQTLAGHAPQAGCGGNHAERCKTDRAQWLKYSRRNAYRATYRTTTYSNVRNWPITRRRGESAATYSK